MPPLPSLSLCVRRKILIMPQTAGRAGVQEWNRAGTSKYMHQNINPEINLIF